jgi:uncharacterized membrane protein YgcG
MADLEKQWRDAEVATVAFVISDPRGRALLSRIMTWCGLNRSVFTQRPGVRAEDWIVMNGAQQDVAHFISREIKCADPDGRMRVIMESEERARLIMEEEAKRKEKLKEKKNGDGNGGDSSGGDGSGGSGGGESGE